MVPPETEQPNGIASLFEGLDKGAIKNLRRKAKRDKRKAKREVEAQKKAETAERMKALKKKNKDKYDPIKGKLIRQEEKRLKALGIVPKWKKAKAEAHKRAMEEKTAKKAEKKAKKQALKEQKERQRELSKKLQLKRELGIVDGDDDGEENPSKKAKRDPAPLLIKLEGLDAIIKEGWPVFSKDNIDQKTGSYMNNKARRKAVRGYEQTVKKAETLRKRLTKQGVEVPAAPEVPPNPAEQQEMTKKERRKLRREQQEKDGGEGGSEKKEKEKEKKEGDKREQKPSNSSSPSDSDSDSSDSDSDSDDGSSDGEEEGGKVKTKKEKADSGRSESESDSDSDDDDTSSSSSSDEDDCSSSDSDSESADDDDKDASDNDDDSSSSSSDDDSSDDDDNEDNKDAKDSSSSDSSSSDDDDDDDDKGDEPQPKHQKTNKGTKASTPPPNSSSENATKKPSSSSSAAVAAAVVPPPPAPWAEVGDRTLATTLPPLTKALYSPHPDITAMSASEVEAFQTERCITLHDADIRPILSFPQSGLSPKELTATKSFAAPSPIQAQCLPVALSGRDLVGIAATGSGKTLAFGLPALRHIRAQNEAAVAAGGGNNSNKNTFNNSSRKRGPQVLVLAPTRELALQIHAVLQEAGRPCGIASVCIYGGVPKRDQLMALRNTNPAIAVATPGRLEDLMSDGSCRLDNVSYLVLDEADRMLDLGFEPAIRKIAGATRADRQTLMFSATWPSAIRKLASEFLSGPARVTIGSEELSAARSVKQTVEVIEDGARDGKLHELLQKHHVSSSKSKNNSNGGQNNRVIVFVLYKKEAARVEEKLTRKGWKVAAVHGDLSQAQRTAAVEAFKAGTTPLLVATDVAARGLDIPDVEVVINYSFPLTVEDYVHRIGRTGRAGKSGISHTFFVGANDKPRAGELINVLKEAGQAVPEELYKFGTTVKKKESKMYGAHFRDVDHTKKATKMKFGSDSE